MKPTCDPLDLRLGVRRLLGHLVDRGAADAVNVAGKAQVEVGWAEGLLAGLRDAGIVDRDDARRFVRTALLVRGLVARVELDPGASIDELATNLSSAGAGPLRDVLDLMLDDLPTDAIEVRLKVGFEAPHDIWAKLQSGGLVKPGRHGMEFTRRGWATARLLREVRSWS